MDGNADAVRSAPLSVFNRRIRSATMEACLQRLANKDTKTSFHMLDRSNQSDTEMSSDDWSDGGLRGNPRPTPGGPGNASLRPQEDGDRRELVLKEGPSRTIHKQMVYSVLGDERKATL